MTIHIRARGRFKEKTWSILVAATLLVSALPLAAQEYPTKPVKMMVPVAAGGGTDRMTRLIAERLGKAWGQAVVVENRAGAGGNLAANLLAKANPDGYTLMFTTQSPLVVNKSLYADMAFDPDTFVPISLVADIPMILVANPSVPVNSLEQLIAYAKANPGVLNYGSAGNGSVAHLTAELLKSLAGVQMVHVPYNGNSLALNAVVGNQVQILFVELSSALPQINAGKLKALALAHSKRVAVLPQLQLVSEVVPGFAAASWWGIVAPPRTPAATVRKISGAVADVLAEPSFLRITEGMHIDIVNSSPEEMAARIKRDRVRWADIIKTNKVIVD